MKTYLLLICLFSNVFFNNLQAQERSKELLSPMESSKLELSDAIKEEGKKVYISTCAACHNQNSTVKNAGPTKALLGGMTTKAIYTALSSGKMKMQGSTISDEQRKAVAQFLTNRPMVEIVLPKEAFTVFSIPKGVSYKSGWGGNLEGTSFEKQSQINAQNVGSLKVKWTFAFPDGTQVRSKPAVVGDWLIIGSQFGDVYALNKKTGKIGWHYQGSTAIRGAIAIAKNSNGELLAYFADYATNVYALSLASGKLIWKNRSGVHPQSSNTGSVAVFQNTVFVPLTSSEVSSSKDPNFECCTSSGELVAMNATTGEIKWRHRVITEEAKESGKKKDGKSFFGPSGAIVWCSPTIDTQRGLVYIGTGENYTDPATNTSDAIQAIDIKTGKLVWNFQATTHDTWNLACPGEPNCPDKAGPDLDFGSAPLLVKAGYNGKDIIVAGQKSGVVHALDPSTGKVIWQTRIGKGGALGGIHWGMATDGKNVYAANADNIYAIDAQDENRKPSPGLYAINIGNGEVIWQSPTPTCPQGKNCIQANSAAPLALPDLVFAGTLEGHIRAYDNKTGKILWEFDTVKEYEAINGIKGKGGSIDGPSPVVSENMLYVNSGYGMFGEVAGNVLIAFELEKK
ncbi:PQQ-binding-like beta-propeller repeat protein [Emticicia sp. SJ17W-69]|uniref:outer membrane protein assembly factor BamB family protein n=1 Tax=Emticicia sp. SJ17W-69 TaxID=3421657 RepID=UPI003EB87DF2